MIGRMTETPSTPASSPDPRTEPVVTAPPQPTYVETPEQRRRPNRVITIAAWVGIVAGVVFIVAVVFFSGFVLGRSSDGGGHRGGGPGHGQMFHRDGPGPMMGPRGQFDRPGMPFGPGQPGMQTPQQTSPGSPTTTAPARP
ncbi:hypothetical protein AU196_12925 [Mycobacterium sp. IS-1742]|uniref:hypothetical protein n=1 Tax=Mycobacterium sp. IS-1742 TaxID=1772285 RepID=UPI0007400048|nr:hypothetical protein [Mycobacterium sp. IS-1742]KUI33187.1 hypothetical protein AU196_12925 [Mycobacterium sp. IS-1742]